MTITPITPQLDVSSRSGSGDGGSGAKTSGFADILDAAQQRVSTHDDDRDPNVDAADDGTDAASADATDNTDRTDGTDATDATDGTDPTDDADGTATPDDAASALLQATVKTNELLQPEVGSTTEVTTPVTNGDVTAALDANAAGAKAVGAIGQAVEAGATAATAKAATTSVADDGPGTVKTGTGTTAPTGATGTTSAHGADGATTPAPTDGPAPDPPATDPAPTDAPTDPAPTEPVAEVPVEQPPAEPVAPPVDETTNTLADVAEALATLDSVAPAPTAETTLAPRVTPTIDSTSSALSGASLLAPTIHTTSPSPVANGAAVASSTPTPVPVAPQEQVVAVLAPMQHQNDGVYRLRLELHPAELGRVEIDVELRNGVLHANLHAEQATAAHVLRDAISDLKVRLEAQGVRAGDVTVDGRGPGNTGGRERSTGGPGSARGGANNRARNDTSSDDEPRHRRQPVEVPESVLDLRM